MHLLQCDTLLEATLGLTCAVLLMIDYILHIRETTILVNRQAA